MSNLDYNVPVMQYESGCENVAILGFNQRLYSLFV